jgi:hypothetical protein
MLVDVHRSHRIPVAFLGADRATAFQRRVKPGQPTGATEPSLIQKPLDLLPRLGFFRALSHRPRADEPSRTGAWDRGKPRPLRPEKGSLAVTALTTNNRAARRRSGKLSGYPTNLYSAMSSGPLTFRHRGGMPEVRSAGPPMSRGERLPHQHVRSRWKDRVDFAAGSSIRTSHWVLSVVLRSKLRLCSRNCSWWFPQGSTSELRKLLNLLMPK